MIYEYGESFDDTRGLRGLSAAVIWRAWKDACGCKVSGTSEGLSLDEPYHEREAYVWLFMGVDVGPGSFFWYCQILGICMRELRLRLWDRYHHSDDFEDMSTLCAPVGRSTFR